MKASLTKYDSFEALKGSKIYCKNLSIKAQKKHKNFEEFIELMKANIITTKKLTTNLKH